MIILPEGFFIGASTAAYQVEGNNIHADFWDWERRKSWERSGLATDSWNRFEEDLACLKQAGLNAYRFSVEWSRIFPEEGKLNQAALKQYARQASLLREAGIEPMVCLHHFTNPAWLFKRYPNGWADPAVVPHFLEFVRVVSQALSAQVIWWGTFNEPMVYAMEAHNVNHFPPGHLAVLGGWRKWLYPALKHIAQAHRGAYEIIKNTRPEAQIGIIQHIDAIEPYEDKESHRQAAGAWDEFFHWTLLDTLTASLDFIGVNYYTRVFVRNCPWAIRPFKALPLYAEIEMVAGPWIGRLLGTRRGTKERDDMGHEMHPEGLAPILMKAWKRYKKPILLTENGAASTDDSLKTRWLDSHLSATLDARKQGADVRGYLWWSLMDNYEWGSYRYRFGLFRVERGNGFRRIPTQTVEYLKNINRTVPAL